MIAPRPAPLQCVLDRLCLPAKTSFLKFFVFLFVCSLAAVRDADGKEADAATVERLRGSVEFLAADEQEGRGVGTAGLNKAADYIRKRFAEFGLKTDAVDGGAFQSFEIPWKTELGPKEQNRLVLVPPSKDGQAPKITELVLDRDFTPMGDGGTGKVTAQIIFAGYGITAKDEDYDDYANVDVKDKIVLILRREPQQNNPHSVFNGTENSDYALFRLKVSNAYEHGAAALIIVNDAYSLSQDLKKQRDRLNETFEKLSAEKAAFAELESPTIAQVHEYGDKLASLAKNFETLATNLSKPVDSLIPFQEGGGTNPRKMPVLFAKREFFTEAISASFDGKSLEEIEKEIDGELKPLSRELSGWQMEAETNIVRLKADVKNVIGVLPGQGELAKQVVIVGAHYDHVGMGGAGSGSLAPWTSEIHNGADDNASGSAGLLEIARSLAGLKAENHRTIVFIAFTAEERGLLGSNYYVQHPVFPLEQTVAMVNLDMIGRLKDNKLIVYGTGTAKTFDKLIDDVNKDYEFEIVKKPSGYGPSDHESFYSKKIPVFHMFTGLHQDYHRPSDDFDKLDYAAIAKIAELVSVIVEDLATVKDRPEYVAIGRERGGLAEQSGLRAYFGSQPDFAAEAEGYAISGASNGSPAEKAGLKGGDVIIKLEDSRIGGLEDFDSALRKYKPGEKVKVIVLRDGKEMTFEVTLEER